MPVILPSPEELERMDWREREKAMNRARRTMQALREAETQAGQRLERLWDEAASDWAEATRAEARRLLDVLPPDPLASEHRRVASEVSNARCA